MYQVGDSYLPVCNSDIPQIGICTFLEEGTFIKEFGSYKIIKFIRKLTNVEFRDIFRISDGKDLWLGCCSREEFNVLENDFNPYSMPLIYIESADRSHLTSLVDTTEFYHLQDDPIEFLTRLFIEASEKELENHFNSLSLT